MHLINLFVKRINGALTIGVEQVVINDYRDSKCNVWVTQKTIQQYAMDYVGASDAQQLVAELKREEVRKSTCLNLNDKDQPMPVYFYLTQYSIPNTARFQIPVFQAIGDFIARQLFDSVVVSDGAFFDNAAALDLKQFKEKLAAHPLHSSEAFDYLSVLAKKIAEQEVPSADQAVSAYTKYHQFAQQHGQSFIDCLLAKNRYLIDHWDQLPASIQNKKFATPLYIILEHAQKIMLPSDAFQELLNEVARDAKKALFLPCLGKKARDGRWYNLSYTEFTFIKNLDFSLINGQLVVNLDTNEGYKEFYAAGKKNHEIFVDEMNYLAQYNGWELEDNDFHLHMAFSRKCSARLLQTGIFGVPPKPQPQLGILGTLKQMFFPAEVPKEEESLGYSFFLDN